jgi:hypothetical protein
MRLSATPRGKSQEAWRSWFLWLVPKAPFLLAVVYAGWQDIASNWGRAFTQEVQIRAIFVMMVGWLASEGLDTILNRWRNSGEQVGDRVGAMEERLDRKLDALFTAWGAPIIGADNIFEAITASVSATRTQPRLWRTAHGLDHRDVFLLRKRIVSFITTHAVQRGWEHYHLWQVDSPESCTQAQEYICEHSDDDRCQVWCSKDSSRALGVDLVLIDRTQAFVIMTTTLLVGGPCLAYHLRGETVIEPLDKLWEEWLQASSKVLDRGTLDHKALGQLEPAASEPVASKPTPAVQAVTEADFWTELEARVTPLDGPATGRTRLDEVRLGGGFCVDHYDRLDLALSQGIESARIRQYRRGHVVLAGSEWTRRELNALDQFIRDGGERRGVYIFVSAVKGAAAPYPLPWNLWLFRPENLLFLIVPVEDAGEPSYRFLLVRDAELVTGFAAQLDAWWQGKPATVSPGALEGFVCRNGTLYAEILGLLRRELAIN